MATNDDFRREFAALCQDCVECWTKEDLQLAAELGKTLLERNKELETSLRQCQNIIDEQVQEIEYLTKQSTALRKTNDSRIRIYEHLEVSIQELERANQRLALDNATDKKQIKSLCAYRDILETRCDELQKALDEARLQQTIQKEKLRRLSSSKECGKERGSEGRVAAEDGEKEAGISTKATAVSQTSFDLSPKEETEDLVNQLSAQNEELKCQMSKDQRKIADLEEEVCRRVQDMALLEEELCQREEQVNCLREKMSNLEEIRSENLCTKCLKEIGMHMPHELQMLFDPEEEEPMDEGKKYSSEIIIDNKEENAYRTLADMYESLVKEQTEHRKLSVDSTKFSPINYVSLRDELKPFEFQGLNKDPYDDEEHQNKDDRKIRKSKMFLQTATDFSEAETSSSGFSDETSNKSTQTESNLLPGSFLCSIADGDDCKFSIYDDACPIESRFRKTPEYRALFREIFAVLKRAAEAKENGEQLPLLDDVTPSVPKVPPVTPAAENPPVGFEDVQSLPESLCISEVASETSSTVDYRLEDTLKDNTSEDASSVQVVPESSKKPKDVKQTNDILEYVSIATGSKKKSRRRCNDSPARRVKVSELVEKIEAASLLSPRKSGGRRRKEWRNYDSPESGAISRTNSPAIQPHVLTTLERKETPPNAYNKTSRSWAFQSFVSTAAQEVAKLKKLEKSYAEVLKNSTMPKSFGRAKNVRLLQ